MLSKLLLKFYINQIINFLVIYYIKNVFFFYCLLLIIHFYHVDKNIKYVIYTFIVIIFNNCIYYFVYFVLQLTVLIPFAGC